MSKKYTAAFDFARRNLGLKSFPKFKRMPKHFSWRNQVKAAYSGWDQTIYITQPLTPDSLVHELVHYKQDVIDKNPLFWVNWGCLLGASYLHYMRHGMTSIEKEARMYQRQFLEEQFSTFG